MCARLLAQWIKERITDHTFDKPTRYTIFKIIIIHWMELELGCNMKVLVGGEPGNTQAEIETAELTDNSLVENASFIGTFFGEEFMVFFNEIVAYQRCSVGVSVSNYVTNSSLTHHVQLMKLIFSIFSTRKMIMFIPCYYYL